MQWGVVVLAAGLGTRMRSRLPKVLHEVGGQPLVDHVLDLALGVTDAHRVVVVVGHGAEQVSARVSGRGARTVLQEPQLGTGDALRVGITGFDAAEVEALLVLSGDVPLLRPQTVTSLQAGLATGTSANILTARLDQPAAYGRVVRDDSDGVRRVVEARDADPEILALHEVNAGVYAFRMKELLQALEGLTTDNAQGEYYLTDVVEALRESGRMVGATVLADPDEMSGVNTRRDLARVASIVNSRVLELLMDEGVTVVDPTTTWVDPSCRVAPDAVLEPGVQLRGACRVGEGARVGAHAVLDDVHVEAGEVVPPLTRREGTS